MPPQQGELKTIDGKPWEQVGSFYNSTPESVIKEAKMHWKKKGYYTRVLPCRLAGFDGLRELWVYPNSKKD